MGRRDDLIAKYASDLKDKCGVTPDLDLHCEVRNENDNRVDRVYHGNKAGILDVDANFNKIVDDPVENMAFKDRTLRQAVRP